MARCRVMPMLDVSSVGLDFIPVLLARISQSAFKAEYALRRKRFIIFFAMATSPKSDSAESPQFPSHSSPSQIEKQSFPIGNAELPTSQTLTKPVGLICQLDPLLQSGTTLSSFGKPKLTNESGFPVRSPEDSRNERSPHTVEAGGYLSYSSLPPVKRARICEVTRSGYASDALLVQSFASDRIGMSQSLATSGIEPGMIHPRDQCDTSSRMWWNVSKVSIPQSMAEHEARQSSMVGPFNPSENKDFGFVNKEIDFMFQRPVQSHEFLPAQNNGLQTAAMDLNVPISSISSHDMSSRDLSQDVGEHQSLSHKDPSQHWLKSFAVDGEQTTSKMDFEQNRESLGLKLGGIGHAQDADISRRSFVQWRPSVCDASSRVVDEPLPRVSPVQVWNQQRILQVTQVTSGTSFYTGTTGQGTTNANKLFPGVLPLKEFIPFFLPGIDVSTSAFAGVQPHLLTSQGQQVHVVEPDAFMPLVSEGLMPHVSSKFPSSRPTTNAHPALASSTIHDYESNLASIPGHAHATPGLSVLRPADQMPVSGKDALPSVTVVMEGQSALWRICLQEHCGYSSFAHAIRMIVANNNSAQDLCTLGGECDLENAVPGHRIAYEDDEGDLLLVGDLPWRDFAHSARQIRVVPSKSRGKQSSVSS
ncbi:hypothetical protein O6H91_12G019900 [Diphasiastrum complanatum]|uniref:Uncharacterized protein n=1 Tax=Diphasiastrum complanatum TaxID=34168 RepID=A0ACC2BZG2_DIPCM|nr:hypothetical protein O6H91_12G019900 [Diphasiastrum complanatum]